MTRDELIARLKGYEWTDFECKKAQSNVPKDAYSTVSAFANTQGGWLLFGVSENKGQLEVSGIDPTAFDRVQNAFLTTLRSGQKLNHIISAEPHVYELEDKRILAFFMVHPVIAYLASWIPKILSLKNSISLKPYACLFIVLILLFVPSMGPDEIG
jgi:predicted HTH transcriptional regulator